MLINRTPEIMPLPPNSEEDFIKMPFIPGSCMLLTQLVGIGLTKLPAPQTNSFEGQGGPLITHKFLIHYPPKIRPTLFGNLAIPWNLAPLKINLPQACRVHSKQGPSPRA